MGNQVSLRVSGVRKARVVAQTVLSTSRQSQQTDEVSVSPQLQVGAGTSLCLKHVFLTGVLSFKLSQLPGAIW